MTKTEQTKYVKKVALIIKDAATTHGYKIVAPLIALAVIKSGRGEAPTVAFNNVFALTVGNSKQAEAVHRETFKKYNVRAKSNASNDFRTYETLEDAVDSFIVYLNSYYPTLKNCKNYKSFAKELANNNFVNNYNDILNVIEREKVGKYDK